MRGPIGWRQLQAPLLKTRAVGTAVKDRGKAVEGQEKAVKDRGKAVRG